MAKITELTKEQEVELEQFYKECLDIGRSCTPIDHAKAESIITGFYKRINKKAPEFKYYNSPHEILVKNPGVDLNMYFGGQQWIHWKALYKFAERIGVEFSKDDSKLLDEWFEESKHLHWWFPFEDECLISERPIRLTVNEGGFLHNEKYKAIEYADGWGMYYLNGIKVPEYLVITPSEDLNIDFFLKEKNADVKAEFVRKFGVERMLDMGKKIDSYDKYNKKTHPYWHESQYELWDMAKLFEGLDYQPYVKMVNQTTGIWHVEAVSPACRTLKDALKERFGGRDMKILAIA
jgi:hypothetical protein